MHTQTKQPPDDRFANVAVQLDELLERGEISPEAFAVYAQMADAALSSILDSSGHTHNTFVEVRVSLIAGAGADRIGRCRRLRVQRR
jgi:hypothetical protein